VTSAEIEPRHTIRQRRKNYLWDGFNTTFTNL